MRAIMPKNTEGLRAPLLALAAYRAARANNSADWNVRPDARKQPQATLQWADLAVSGGLRGAAPNTVPTRKAGKLVAVENPFAGVSISQLCGCEERHASDHAGHCGCGCFEEDYIDVRPPLSHESGDDIESLVLGGKLDEAVAAARRDLKKAASARRPGWEPWDPGVYETPEGFLTTYVGREWDIRRDLTSPTRKVKRGTSFTQGDRSAVSLSRTVSKVEFAEESASPNRADWDDHAPCPALAAELGECAGHVARTNAYLLAQEQRMIECWIKAGGTKSPRASGQTVARLENGWAPFSSVRTQGHARFMAKLNDLLEGVKAEGGNVYLTGKAWWGGYWSEMRKAAKDQKSWRLRQLRSRIQKQLHWVHRRDYGRGYEAEIAARVAEVVGGIESLHTTRAAARVEAACPQQAFPVLPPGFKGRVRGPQATEVLIAAALGGRMGPKAAARLRLRWSERREMEARTAEKLAKGHRVPKASAPAGNVLFL